MRLFYDVREAKISAQLSRQGGFTLTELLIAMVVSGIVVGATSLVLATMVRNHNTEVRVTTMHQNLRSTMNYMERYIRMAGYDPLESADAEFTKLLSNNIAFTRDKGRPSGVNIDNDPNGVIDSHWEEMIEFKLDDDRLERVDENGVGHLLAEDIEVLNFVYLDNDGDPTNNSDDVRSVQIAIIARSSGGFVNDYSDTTTYTNQQGAVILPAQNDNIRRIMLSSDVSCRNMEW
ncbi:prepilin-type N-terminal cleavage/methylation domain-containing protein [Desulforhopalus sp. 52FAK]